MANPPNPSQPTITSANLPKPPAAVPKAPTPQAAAPPQPPIPEPEANAFEANAGGVAADGAEEQLPVQDTINIIARPLSDPDFLGIKPKNPMHQLYWANRGHQNGLRVNYRAAQGFRLANKNDIKDCPTYMIDPSGQIIHGDLVAMIIGKNAYQGALLHNHNKGIRRVNKFGQIQQNWVEKGDGTLEPMGEVSIDAVQATLSEVRASPMNKQKVRAFVPDASTLDSMMSGSKPEKP